MIKRDRVVSKFEKAVRAKASAGKANYPVDSIFDEALGEPILDELAHLLMEGGLDAGTAEQRMKTRVRKALKYRNF